VEQETKEGRWGDCWTSEGGPGQLTAQLSDSLIMMTNYAPCHKWSDAVTALQSEQTITKRNKASSSLKSKFTAKNFYGTWKLKDQLDATDWFLYCKTYCSLNMFRAPLCLSSGAATGSKHLYKSWAPDDGHNDARNMLSE